MFSASCSYQSREAGNANSDSAAMRKNFFCAKHIAVKEIFGVGRLTVSSRVLYAVSENQSNKVRTIRECSGYFMSHMSACSASANSSHQSVGMAALYNSRCAYERGQ